MSETRNRRTGGTLRQYAVPIFAASVAAVLLLPICVFASAAVLLGYIGLLVSLLLGIAIAALLRPDNRHFDSDLLRIPFQLARDEELADKHQTLGTTLLRIAEHDDPLFRNLALQQVESRVCELEPVGEGTISFHSSEAWRLAYEQLLRSPGLHLYRSIACVDSPAYWQDEPGRRSMALNFEMQESGNLSIERTVILADELWPSNEDLPAEPIRSWIDEQHTHGIWVRMVRRSVLLNEPDLCVDLGIYGSRAVGVQERLTDMTWKFTLRFDFEEVKKAEQKWARLGVYGTSYQEALDRHDAGL